MKRNIPIDVHFSTLGGLQYSLEGVLLQTSPQFHSLFDPVGDYEISRMLDRSEASEDISKMLLTMGFLGLATGAAGILLTSSSEHTGFLLCAIGGGVVFDIGGLFRSEAQTAKFNSVQRYNRFARGEEQALPKVQGEEKDLLHFDPARGPSNGH